MGRADRTVAAIRAALLDAEIERLVAMRTISNPDADQATREVLLAFRHRIVAWNGAKRAALA